MFKESKSLSSMNFAATIWLTSCAVTREKSGPTTKGWCKTAIWAKDVAPSGLSGTAVVKVLGEDDGKSEGIGGENMETNVCATKFDLP